MYESTRLKVDHMMGPRGPLTADDLPAPGTKRWTVRRKAEAVTAIRSGLLSLGDGSRWHALNEQEFQSSQYCIDCHGRKSPGARN